jgi:hypothetical protein
MPGRNWSQQEIAYLKEHYPNTRVDEIANFLKRTDYAVKMKAYYLGLKQSTKFSFGFFPQWTAEELNTLKEFYPITTKDEIAEKIPKRTHRAIKSKASQLGLRRFKNTEKILLSPKVAEIAAWSIAWEGAISVSIKHSKKPHKYVAVKVEIANTNLDLLKSFQKLVCCGKISALARYQPNRKPCWRWYISGYYGCLHFLRHIHNFLPAKQKQSELVMKLCEHRLNHYRCATENWELELAKEVNILNKRGID